MPVVPIPDASYDFGTLIAAQSIGDHRSLLAHGRRVLRVGGLGTSAQSDENENAGKGRAT